MHPFIPRGNLIQPIYLFLFLRSRRTPTRNMQNSTQIVIQVQDQSSDLGRQHCRLHRITQLFAWKLVYSTMHNHRNRNDVHMQGWVMYWVLVVWEIENILNTSLKFSHTFIIFMQLQLSVEWTVVRIWQTPITGHCCSFGQDISVHEKQTHVYLKATFPTVGNVEGVLVQLLWIMANCLPTYKHLPLSVTDVWLLGTLTQCRHGVSGCPTGLCCTTYSCTLSENGGSTDHDTVSSWFFPLTSNATAGCRRPTKMTDTPSIFPARYILNRLQIAPGSVFLAHIHNPVWCNFSQSRRKPMKVLALRTMIYINYLSSAMTAWVKMLHFQG